MNSLTLTTLLCALAASAWVPTEVLAQEAPSKPLDLSLPKEALSGAWGSATQEDAARLPDLGGPPSPPAGAAGRGRGGGPQNELPYGAGYEARHGQSGSGSGSGAAGAGAGAGAGRGMGRGR